MSNTVHPALILIFGALMLPLLKKRVLKQICQLLIPVVAFIELLSMHEGIYWIYRFMTYDLIFGRVDRLSMCFAYVFVIITFLSMIYALHVKEDGQHSAAFLYAGSALGMTFAGDFFTLFVFWELMAISSVFLIWYGKGSKALEAGFRYIMVHLFGGCALLAGIVLYVADTGSTAFTKIEFGGLASILILLGFIINAAVPPFHAWLTDAYPEATITGTIFLSVYTTKTAVYVLLRGFPEVELLAWMGAVMALYGIVYVMLENNIRRLLAYHIISQVGFMVCGVGLGSEMSMNGAAAHAFNNALYKPLLLMGAGVVIEATGKTKITELQGSSLYRKMPVCFFLYMVGAFSISAVPLFNGFVSKNMIVFAAGELHRTVIHLLIHLASIGTFLSLSLKLPYAVWFGGSAQKVKNEKVKTSQTPANMLVAMGLTAFLCIFIGLYPKALYDLLPFPVHYRPYTVYAVSGMVQLLVFTAIAFWLFIGKMGSKPGISIDTDWFYRKGALFFMRFCKGFVDMRSAIQGKTLSVVESAARLSINPVQACRFIFTNKKLHIAPYSADRVRQPIGMGVMFFLVLFSLFCLLFFSYI